VYNNSNNNNNNNNNINDNNNSNNNNDAGWRQNTSTLLPCSLHEYMTNVNQDKSRAVYRLPYYQRQSKVASLQPASVHDELTVKDSLQIARVSET